MTKNTRNTILAFLLGVPTAIVLVLALRHPCTWAPNPPDPEPVDGGADETGAADTTG